MKKWILGLLTLALSAGMAIGQTPHPMADGDYSEDFADITNWTNSFASGVGANRWSFVAVNASGTIPDGSRTSNTTATFVTGSSAGVQRGTGNIQLLSTGATDNTSAVAIDLFLDFTGRLAGTLSFDWASVNNSTGDRKGSLRIYTSTDGSTFTELAGASVLNFTNNVLTNGSVTEVQLPSSFDNISTARIRFYYHNGNGGTTGSRPKISFDNLAVTSTSADVPFISISTTEFNFGTIEAGTISGGQFVMVSGANLTDDITITLPVFVLAKIGEGSYGSDPIVLVQSGGVVEETQVDFIFAPDSKGLYDNDVDFTSTGATTKNLTVTATVFQKVYSHRGGEVFTMLNDPTSWNTAADSTGDPISDFTDTYTYYVVQYGRAGAPFGYLNGDWEVTGTGSKVVLAANTGQMYIPNGVVMNATIDLEANSAIEIENTNITWTLGNISPTSIVSYTAMGTMTIPVYTYGDLYLSNGTKKMAGGTINVLGNFALENVSNFEGGVSPFTTINIGKNVTVQGTVTYAEDLASRMTWIMNGTTSQGITGNGNDIKLFRLTLQNSSGVTLYTGGGSTNVVVGNLTGGGVTLTSGSLTTNANSVTFQNSATGGSIINENATNRIIGTVIMNKKVGTSTSTLGNIGVSLATGGDSLGTVTILRRTGPDGATSYAGQEGIERTYTISSTLNPTSGRTFSMTWLSSDDNEKDLANGVLYKSTTSGASWEIYDMGDYTARTVTVSNETVWGMYTVSDGAAPLPVELSSFTVAKIGGEVILNWSTTTETNNYGFEVEAQKGSSWNKIGFVAGNGTTTEAQTYTFVDHSVSSGTVSYRLKQIDFDGKYAFSSVQTLELTPETFELLGNYPNPFNPTTMINFQTAYTGQVTVTVFDVLGRQVGVILNAEKQAGKHQVPFDATGISSGLYFYQVKAGNEVRTGRMLLSK